MNNWQLMVAAGFPTLAVLVGILVNTTQISRLDSRIDTLGDKLSAEIAELRRDLREFYRVQGQHEIRIANLEKNT